MTVSSETPTGGPPGPGSFCVACGAGLSSGARFCHRCGTRVGDSLPLPRSAAGAPNSNAGLAGVLPWGVAFVALLALVAMVAGRNFGAARGSQVDGSANALATPSMDGPALGSGAPGSGPRAPDISNLTPEQRAERLYERVMTYDEAGMRDSAALFASMALPAHEMLENISLDERYHAGRIAEAAGLTEMALAQADTILRTDANHLLGLILGTRIARVMNDSAKAREYEKTLLQVIDSERARRLPEYDQHQREIERALNLARSSG